MKASNTMSARDKILKQQSQKSRNDISGQIDEEVKKFNKIVLELVGVLIQADKKNKDLVDIRDKVIAAKGTTPTLLIEEGGPIFLSYKEQIKTGKLESLMNINYQDKLNEFAQKAELKAESVDEVTKMINFIKSMIQKFSEPEKAVIAKNLKKALAAYAKYVQLSRTLESESK